MTRIGVNPARGKTTGYRPAPVSVAVLTFIPALEGYFEGKLDVLKLVLASLHAHTTLPHDLIIFDNGSCPEVVEYLTSLKRLGMVDYLLLSRQNIGKIDALRILFNAAPGEVIAYNDDDIFFYPGWLEAHLDVLESFPGAGMVSGVPVRDAAGRSIRSLEKLILQEQHGLNATRERRIPDEWEHDWALSTGRDPAAHLEATTDRLDLVLKSTNNNGSLVEGIAGANHFQFVTPKEVILQALPEDWSGRLMGEMLELDEAVDNLGYLRLSTTQRFTRHLGNRLSDEIRQEAVRMGIELDGMEKRANIKLSQPQTRRKHWLLHLPGARRLLHGIYRRLFDILFNA